MKTVGIIAEYNPFHKGHALLIKKIKEKIPESRILIIMSGHIVQRGDFAIQDKWQRAVHAIQNGADLVIELPYCYSGQTAERFAYGGVALADSFNCDYLAFGVETDDLSVFEQIANVLIEEPAEFQNSLHHHLDMGLGFAKARTMALRACLKTDCSAVMSAPNSILAVEYIKAIKKNNFAMLPLPVLRQGNSHHNPDLSGLYASASAIRQALISKDNPDISNFLPENTEIPDKKKMQAVQTALEQQLMARLLTTTPEKLRNFPDVTEGLEFSLLNGVKYKDTIKTIIEDVSSKRITKSRIRRILINMLTDFTKDDFQQLSLSRPTYLRVLAFNKNGKAMLRQVSDSGQLPVMTNLHSNQTRLSLEGRQSLTFDCRATDLFYLFQGEPEKIHADYTQHPIYVEET